MFSHRLCLGHSKYRWDHLQTATHEPFELLPKPLQPCCLQPKYWASRRTLFLAIGLYFCANLNLNPCADYKPPHNSRDRDDRYSMSISHGDCPTSKHESLHLLPLQNTSH